MKNLLLIFFLCSVLVVPVKASEISAPTVPRSGEDWMPEQTDSFEDALRELLEKSVRKLQPELQSALGTCTQILFVAVLFSLFPVLASRTGGAASVAAAGAICALVFQQTDALIRLASDAVREICAYGKLLCPVMTAALGAQGAVSASAALYMGTTVFTALLGSLISACFVPLVYAFLSFGAANSAFGEDFLRKFADGIKNMLSWLLKTLLMVFTTYMSITGVVSGITDTAALKAAKVTISTAVPVVGGILSDASEAVLVSVGLMKNAAGIYGILAVLSVLMGPFLKVGAQYLALKLTGALCSVFAGKSISTLVSDLATAMGLLLAMLAASATLVLISTVCFLKGAT